MHPTGTLGRNLRLPLLTASLAAGLLASSPAIAQVTLAEFRFDEGSGSTTQSATNELIGSLGLPLNP